MDTSTLDRGDGTYAAIVNGVTCTHKHGTEKKAADCIEWETKTLARTGQSAWAREASKSRPATPRLVVPTADGEYASAETLAHSHEYVPMPGLRELWNSMLVGASKRPAGNLIFIGPSGSGKTDGARALAAEAGLSFTKVDAASMTDPEAWFGTRELIVEQGVAVTHYEPSDFVRSIQLPGVTLIDEITRVRDEHRNVLLPVLDATRAVMNPLTGEVIHRHPLNFIIMAGNVGLHFTGTNAVDPAFMTRALVVEFDYIDEDTERRIVAEASGCDDETSFVFTRFAVETRAKAKADDQFLPISTRELIEMGHRVADGLTRDLAVRFVVLNAASGEGGSASIRQELQNLWNGVRALKPERTAADVSGQRREWICPTHGTSKVVPAGVSSKTGRPYSSFKACGTFGCELTEDRSKGIAQQAADPSNSGVILCPDCNSPQPAGRQTFCTSCGASLK